MQNFYFVLKSLLPPGRFFEFKRESAFDHLLWALSLELSRISNLLENLEAIFSYVSNPDWFLKLLNISSKWLVTNEAKTGAITSILDRQGSLSRQYIERRLRALGHRDFTIEDPSEEDLGMEPILDPSWIGRIFVKSKVRDYRELMAGFLVGDSVVQWNDIQFENDINSLIPAHIQVTFLYQREEFTDASSG